MSDEFDEESADERVEVAEDGHHLLLDFRDLTVLNVAHRLDEFIAELERAMVYPWARASEYDKGLDGLGVEWRVFERREDDILPGARLFFTLRKTGDLYVSNIVPTKRRSLGKDNYNAVVAEFTERYVEPAAASLNLEFDLTEALVDLADEIGADAFRALQAAAIYKPATHPSDVERWMHFILMVHRHGIEVDLEHLRRWLVADGFGERRSYELMLEFDFGIRLLSYERDH